MRRRRRARRLVIGLAGKIGSGKTTMASFLSRQFGFAHLRTRDVLAGLLEERGVAPGEAALQDLGAELVRQHGPHAVSDIVLRTADPEGSCVVDSLRHAEEAAHLRARLGDAFRLVYVTVPDDVRRERYLQRDGREATTASFEARMAHEVERDLDRDVPELLHAADATIANLDADDAATQLAALVLKWSYEARPTAVREMLDAVTEFHRKHDFDIGTGDRSVMQYRMGLLVEELGEINECLSKGRGDIAEEHADLLILLLGNCVTMNIDLEGAFWRKYASLMKRPAKRVGGATRVSAWRGVSGSNDGRGYFHVDMARLLRGDEGTDDGDPAAAQLSLFG